MAAILSAVKNSPIPDDFNLRIFKHEFGLENLLDYLWCDVIALVDEDQQRWQCTIHRFLLSSGTATPISVGVIYWLLHIKGELWRRTRDDGLAFISGSSQARKTPTAVNSAI